MKVDKEIMSILKECVIIENGNSSVLQLPPKQLDRKVYEKVNKALQFIGGKWNTKNKGFLFPINADAVRAKFETLMDNIQQGNTIKSEKQVFQFFPTPAELAKKIVEMACVESDSLCLEPSAGQGAIVDAILPISQKVDMVELNQDNAAVLEKKYPYLVLSVNDFLAIVPKQTYDRVIMNPPFSNKACIDHTLHAFQFLKKGGILVSVVDSGCATRSDKKSREFWDWVTCEGEYEEIEAGTFKVSGTMVGAYIVKFVKK